MAKYKKIVSKRKTRAIRVSKYHRVSSKIKWRNKKSDSTVLKSSKEICLCYRYNEEYVNVHIIPSADLLIRFVKL